MAELNLRARTVVRGFPYTSEALAAFLAEVAQDTFEVRSLLLNYPTVYIIYANTPDGYKVYVGETNSFEQRTRTHLLSDPRLIDNVRLNIESGELLPENFTARQRASLKWQTFRDNDTTIVVIGHTLFNKSLTLDIEDRLMLFMSAIDDVDSAELGIEMQNGRRNIQTDYFPRAYAEETFQQIWRGLRKHDKKLFPLERLVRDSALFKASPFHRLNEQQVSAKLRILDAVNQALVIEEDHREQTKSELVLVEGGAGTGKTVLLSSVFYDIHQEFSDGAALAPEDGFDTYLLVNHDEQVRVYQDIAEKLGMGNKKNPLVMKPTKFINEHQRSGKIADVVLVDEAHLLWTQGKQSYQGKNQLMDILSLARVVVAVFDPMQVLAGNQYWSESELGELRTRAGEKNVIPLTQQMRIDSDGPAETWINDLVSRGVVNPIPTNDRYRIEVFDSPELLHEKVREKSGQGSEIEKGLSRLIATYDWKFSSGKSTPADSDTWDVVIPDQNFRLPWNNQGRYTRAEKKLSWAERPSTVEEVGSIFTIQGFDLNYAGVIIGPSVQYRDGQIVFAKSESQNPNVVNRRKVVLGGKEERLDVSESLLRNQLNVLLTRGVRGVGIYAVDRELREALLHAAGA
ncbi:DNA/RNA helicase domain-containing protein [Corynebacterium doosanense]|uniref:Schlafen group 3-like DNA/RNA helicase domain-containing protein n=1 Tax=Corynebacterium doosanense CAU 212 = DSM 45436 TaxID=558173 RepID=A0A097ICW6_9CORY|nr:DNA/RNA helicase domain-containing protein [Corynebacterium doosanense]AIT59972.1 hypothetical protein CDOO_00535 [Corynebacterium doosanense CAU 212 = DSM 45436]